MTKAYGWLLTPFLPLAIGDFPFSISQVMGISLCFLKVANLLLSTMVRFTITLKSERNFQQNSKAIQIQKRYLKLLQNGVSKKPYKNSTACLPLPFGIEKKKN